MTPSGTREAEEAIQSLQDEELARQAQAGSSQCFAELVRRHQDRLLRFLRQRARTPQDAEDILQDTFARAYEHIGAYDPRWKLTTWLFTIASRLTCSLYRRRTALPLADEALLPSRSQDPAVAAARKEERHNLWTLAAESLSRNQYDALWFRYAEGMTVKEISHAMSKTATHVKVLLHRGRNSLGRQLAAPGAAGPGAKQPASAPSCVAGGTEGGG